MTPDTCLGGIGVMVEPTMTVTLILRGNSCCGGGHRDIHSGHHGIHLGEIGIFVWPTMTPIWG